jgi:hypothetical protein
MGVYEMKVAAGKIKPPKGKEKVCKGCGKAMSKCKC